MHTNRQTTFIFLERGTEDRALHEELQSLFRVVKSTSKQAITSLEIAFKYPLLVELMQNLKAELAISLITDQQYLDG